MTEKSKRSYAMICKERVPSREARKKEKVA